MKYLPVSVLSTAGIDCTANGITSTHADNIVVPMEDGFLTQEDIDNGGYKVLEIQASRVQGYPQTFKQAGETRWTMFGGNYVTTSDSRFGKKYGHSPIAVHDRIEG